MALPRHCFWEQVTVGQWAVAGVKPSTHGFVYTGVYLMSATRNEYVLRVTLYESLYEKAEN